MTPLLLILASLQGQCFGNSCASPSMSFGVGGSFASQAFAAPLSFVQAPPAYVPMLAKYRIRHDGMSFTVEGWQFEQNGGVTWHPDRPFNVKALNDARAKQASDMASANAVPVPTHAIKPEPAPTGEVIGQIQNFGLRPEKMGRQKPDNYTANSEEAQRFITEEGTPVESGRKLHVTVIGSDDEQARVLNDIKTDAAFDAIRDQLMVQGYKPGEWPVDKSLGFQTDGHPSIFVQASKGSKGDKKGGLVVLRTNDYKLGPKGLAEAIRKADPNYKPGNDPGPSAGKGGVRCPLGFDNSHWPIVVAVGAIVAFIIFKLPRREG